MEIIEEREYFGPLIGEVSLWQSQFASFQQACLSKNDNNNSGDLTGIRLYAGAHVAIRFMHHYLHLFANRSIIELGCGIGALGTLLFCHPNHIKNLLLTDANESTLEVCQRNVHKLLNNYRLVDKWERVHVNALLWQEVTDYREPIESIATLHRKFNDNQSFDMVIACELTYFNTDISTMLSTVLQLLYGGKDESSSATSSSTGLDSENAAVATLPKLFMHAHLFRRYSQEQELIDYFAKVDWITYEVPTRIFIAAEELKDHPEWYRVRALISGPRVDMERLATVQYPEWKIFQMEMIEEEAYTFLKFNLRSSLYCFHFI